MKTIRAAFNAWKEEIKTAGLNKADFPAMAESWNNFTDALCKEGELTELQYHYCPSWDEIGVSFQVKDDWAAEFEWIISRLCVKFHVVGIPKRMDGSNWSPTHNHAHVTISREAGKESVSYACEYSWGKSQYKKSDILNCVLNDAGCVDEHDFDDFVDEFGFEMDSREKRRKAQETYLACQRANDAMRKMFSASELESLRAISNEL